MKRGRFVSLRLEKKELREKTKAEIEKILLEKREALRELRFKKAGGELKNVREIGHIRRTIAQILTIMKEAG